MRVNLFFKVERQLSEMLEDPVTLNQCEQVIHDICSQKSYAEKKPILRRVFSKLSTLITMQILVL